MTTEGKPREPGAARETEWPKLMARMMEDITRSELHRFEANLAAALRSSVDRGIGGVILVASGVVGGGCLMAALILLLGYWLPWWLSFALAGLAVIWIGQVGYVRHQKRARRETA